MHALLTNDDGPPSDEASPYIYYLYEALKRDTNWDISVALPNTQRSWIGKAHLMNQDVVASYIYLRDEDSYDGPFDSPKKDRSGEWVLLNGTPASCANIGVNHLFTAKGPVDLVISGPNYGRNCTALYIMSSGTVGAALEGALCGIRAIGLSYAYTVKGAHDIKQIRKAAELSVKLFKHLYDNWNDHVDLYTINMPLCDSLSDSTKILYCPVLENRWKSSFAPPSQNHNGQTHFKWSPDFQAVAQTVKDSEPGNDGWVVDHEMIR